MIRGARRAMTMRTTGLLLSAAVALIAAGVTLLVAMNTGPGTAGAQGAGGPNERDLDIDFAELDEQDTSGRLQFVDKDDPTRKAGELLWDQIEPLGNGLSDVTNPSAFIYLEDGRTLHVRADHARIRMVTDVRGEQREPESGDFSGNVIARLFEARPNDPAPIDPDVHTPSLVALMDALSFSSPEARLETESPVIVSTPDIEFRGEGLLALFDEVDQRLEHLRIARGESIRFSPKGDDDDASADVTRASRPDRDRNARPTETANATDRPTRAPVTGPLRQDFYAIELDEQVRVRQSSRTVDAAKLALWVRLIDGALPEDAIAEPRMAERREREAPSDDASVASGTPQAPVSRPIGPTMRPDPNPLLITRRSADDLVVEWDGPMLIRPAPEQPDELGNTGHLALRFTGDDAERVAAADDKLGFIAQAPAIFYNATDMDLRLEGDKPADVSIAGPQHESASLTSLAFNLGTGIGLSLGAGEANAKDTGRLKWSDQAEFVFGLRDGALTSVLQEAAFTGDALTAREDAEMRADFIRAMFAPSDFDEPELTRLQLEGDAIADDGKANAISARLLDITFEPDPSDDSTEPEPVLLIANGAFRGEYKGETLKASDLEARLFRNDEGEIKVERAVATGEVSFNGRKQTTATADRLEAEPERGMTTLYGSPAAIVRDGAAIRGDRIDLSGPDRRIDVPAAGAFTHRPGDADNNDPEMRTVEVRWDEGMSYSDATGVVECDGAVSGVITQGTTGRDIIDAHHLRLVLARVETTDEQPADASDAWDVADGLGEMRLESAELIGHPEGDDAYVRSERFRQSALPTAPGAEPEIEQLMYLQGPRILAFDDGREVTVDGKGKAFMIDAREGDPADASEPTARPPVGLVAEPGDARGRVLITWDGRAEVSREVGHVEIERGVRLLHSPDDGRPPAEILCDRLDADFTEPGPGSSESPDLANATAAGAVYARSGRRELLADTLTYDARLAELIATASADNRVTISDPDQPAPIVARRFYWNLRTDRVVITEPTPITTPR